MADVDAVTSAVAEPELEPAESNMLASSNTDVVLVPPSAEGYEIVRGIPTLVRAVP